MPVSLRINVMQVGILPESALSWAQALAHETGVCSPCAQDSLLLYAQYEGNSCGFISWLVVEDCADLLGIAVDEKARRHGVARALMRASEEQLLAQGVVTLFLEVRNSNSAAQALYQQMGYSKKGRRKAYYANGEDAQLWQKTLRGA